MHFLFLCLDFWASFYSPGPCKWSCELGWCGGQVSTIWGTRDWQKGDNRGMKQPAGNKPYPEVHFFSSSYEIYRVLFKTALFALQGTVWLFFPPQLLPNFNPYLLRSQLKWKNAAPSVSFSCPAWHRERERALATLSCLVSHLSECGGLPIGFDGVGMSMNLCVHPSAQPCANRWIWYLLFQMGKTDSMTCTGVWT